MDKEEKGGAAVDESSAASVEGDGTQTQQTETSNQKTVAWEDHKRVLDDMHRFKKDLVAEKSKISEIEKTRLKEKEDYKTYAERLEEENQKLKQEKDGIFNSLETDRKFEAVRTAALKAGIREEALSLIDNMELTGVIAEKTDQGRMIVHGADDWVSQFKKQHSYAFQNTAVPKFNNGGGNPHDQPKEMSATEFVALERKYRNDPKKLSELRTSYQKQLRQSRTRH